MSNKAKKKKPAEQAGPKTVRAARLDDAGVYQGIDEMPEGELTDLHLPEVTECDLQPGRYRWDPERKTFVPLPRKTAGQAVKEPDAVRAIALGFIAVMQAGIALPQETRDWLAWYARSVDFKG